MFRFDSLEKEGVDSVYKSEPPANRIPVRVFTAPEPATTTTTTERPEHNYRSVIEHRLEGDSSEADDGVLVLGAISKTNLDYNLSPIHRNTSNG